MNTGELYVEPVLIGGLALAMLAAPFAPEILAVLRHEALGKLGDISVAAVLVGAAYFIGILADRVIDTALEELDRHARVRFALSKIKVPEGMTNRCPLFQRDHYPEEKHRWTILSGSERIAGSLHYMRSRVRLLRSLTVLLPALFFTATVGGARHVWRGACGPGPAAELKAAPSRCSDWGAVVFGHPGIGASVALAVLGLFGSAVILAWLLTARDRRLLRQKQRTEPQQTSAAVEASKQESAAWWYPRAWETARTDDPKAMMHYAKARGWPLGKRWKEKVMHDVLAQPIVWCLALLVLAAGTVLLWLTGIVGAVMGSVVGLMVAYATGWTWWRVTVTHHAYMHDAGEYLLAAQRREAARARG